MFSMRPAARKDSLAIHILIYKVGINPMDLDWRRFLLIVDDKDSILACGQVKPHKDGTRELASLAVQPDYRGQGLARLIIERIQAQHDPPCTLSAGIRCSLCMKNLASGVCLRKKCRLILSASPAMWRLCAACSASRTACL